MAYACACWDHPAGGPWLSWALSARLDGALVRVWLPGPGWQSIGWRDCLADRGFGRETHWISELPAGFGICWGRIARGVSQTSRWRLTPKHRRGCWWSWPAVTGGAPSCWIWWRRIRAIPKGLLEEMALDPLALPQVQMRVAQSLNAGPRRWTGWRSASMSGCGSRWRLNPNTSPRTRERLAGDSSVDVRMAVARNSDVAAGVLAALAEDPAMTVRGWAAANPSTPAEALTVLLGDRTALVRSCAAANSAAPVGLVGARVGDRAISVRCAVAGASASTLRRSRRSPVTPNPQCVRRPPLTPAVVRCC